jgi:hypothetical protein
VGATADDGVGADTDVDAPVFGVVEVRQRREELAVSGFGGGAHAGPAVHERLELPVLWIKALGLVVGPGLHDEEGAVGVTGTKTETGFDLNTRRVGVVTTCRVEEERVLASVRAEHLAVCNREAHVSAASETEGTGGKRELLHL